MAGYHSERHHINPLQNNHSVNTNLIQDKILKCRDGKLSVFAEVEEGEDDDTSVYTGSAGRAWTMLKVAKQQENAALAERAKNILVRARRNKKSRQRRGGRVSFIGGICGPPVLLARACHEGSDLNLPSISDSSLVIECCREVAVDHLDAAISEDTPDEVLFGRAGYVLGLITLLRENSIPVESIKVLEHAARTVCQKMIESGKSYSKLRRHHERPRDDVNPTMWWQWHDKEYLGAAHGVSGILHSLLLAEKFLPDGSMIKDILPTLQTLLSYQFPSGNFPSSLGRSEKNDRLVHWCHGSSGLIHLLLEAHTRFKSLNDQLSSECLDAAERCAFVVWTRGLLKKGYSMCHGVSGNAYALLRMWQVTGEQKHLEQAMIFANWCCNSEKIPAEYPPDRPRSLFEGEAGPVYMMTDFSANRQQLRIAKFPGF